MSIKPLALAAAAAALVLAVPASAHTEVFMVVLNAASEFPANSSPATGTGTVTFNDDDYTMRLQVSFSGLQGTTTAAHIHCCTSASGLGSDAIANAAGTSPVATMVPVFTDFPLGVTAGSYDYTFNMLSLASYNPTFVTNNAGSATTDADRAAAAFTALLNGANAGKAYLNIHTTFRAGGEIRGFLAPVPEPSTYALMLAGVATIGVVARRRRST